MENSLKIIIDVLRSDDFYNAGECTEIAKGKYELDYSWSTFKRKFVRIIKHKR